jgi:hypothetical protein
MGEAPRRCRAKAKGTGEQCRRTGGHVCAKCGVCRVHGCNCKRPGGAPAGNQHARTHGLYAEVLTEDLRPHLEAALADLPEDVGALGPEIALARAVVLRFFEESTSFTFGKLGPLGAGHLDTMLAALERIAKLLHRDAAVGVTRLRAKLLEAETATAKDAGAPVETRFRWRVPSDRQALAGAADEEEEAA